MPRLTQRNDSICLHAQRFQLSGHALRRAVALAEQERPQPLQQRRVAFDRQHAPLGNHQSHAHIHRHGRPGRRADGQLIGVALGISIALCLQRAPRTVRRAGHADRRTQIHQRLIPISRPLAVNLPFPQLMDQSLDAGTTDVLPHAMNARQHAGEIAVNSRIGQAIGDAGHRRRRVVPNARQGADALIGGREAAAVLPLHNLRGLVQVARAGIIAQPFPIFEHFLLIGLRQRGDIGKAVQKARVIAAHRIGARLLQHNLGNPHSIRIARTAKGQHPAVCVIPVKKQRIRHASNLQ